MERRKLKIAAKKTLAVISSIALLISCGMTGLFTANAEGETPGRATKMFIYDEYGNLLTGVAEDSAIVYIDNSSKASDGNHDYTKASIKVEIRNEEETLTEELANPG